jgi:hypothetical protein
MVAMWHPNSNSDDNWHCDELVADDGNHIARVESFSHGHYANAFNPRDGEWHRSGRISDAVEAMLWAERVAGEHPLKPGDIHSAEAS